MANNQDHEIGSKGTEATGEENYFKQRENTSDEVVMTFDDGQTMFVSSSFLSYASPVFKAMFQHDFKEKETREVKLTGKKYDDFQEFLLCLHPGVQRPVDKQNVLQIASIADEYQVQPTITKCKMLMAEWLNSEINNAAAGCNNTVNYPRARTCLKILKKANECSFKEIEDLAIKTVSRFGHRVFTGTAPTLPVPVISAGPVRKSKNGALLGSGCGFNFGSQTNQSSEDDVNAKLPQKGSFSEEGKQTKPDNPKEDCKVLFDNLPGYLKSSLLLARLGLCDDGNLR